MRHLVLPQDPARHAHWWTEVCTWLFHATAVSHPFWIAASPIQRLSLLFEIEILSYPEYMRLRRSLMEHLAEIDAMVAPPWPLAPTRLHQFVTLFWTELALWNTVPPGPLPSHLIPSLLRTGDADPTRSYHIPWTHLTQEETHALLQHPLWAHQIIAEDSHWSHLLDLGFQCPAYWPRLAQSFWMNYQPHLLPVITKLLSRLDPEASTIVLAALRPHAPPSTQTLVLLSPHATDRHIIRGLTAWSRLTINPISQGIIRAAITPQHLDAIPVKTLLRVCVHLLDMISRGHAPDTVHPAPDLLQRARLAWTLGKTHPEEGADLDSRCTQILDHIKTQHHLDRMLIWAATQPAARRTIIWQYLRRYPLRVPPQPCPAPDSLTNEFPDWLLETLRSLSS